MIYIGIDPGKKGGVAIIGGDTPVAFPWDDEQFVRELLRLRDGEERAVACVEHVHAMPKQGVSSTFTFGKGAGFIEGVLTALRVPYQLISPRRWKNAFGLDSDKAKSIDVCRKLFPGVSLLATERSKKPHDGMAEALLMAEYARRNM